ncbi:MAG: glycosyltransferase family 4 protein [Vicinamibacterales bacterium]
MRILLATDSFPPGCGGSGWSTFELARGLRGLGHEILLVQPIAGRAEGLRDRTYDNFNIIEFGAPAPPVPFLRNYYKNERLHARLTTYLIDVIARRHVDVVHGQHVLTCLPSIAAARRAGIPSVCTVRDYWPVCYWSDLMHTREDDALCPGCSASMMTHCIRPRAGAAWPLVLPMIPYMRSNLARKQTGLAAADAVIAVSTAIAADLRSRAPELAATRMVVIPNPVDVSRLRAQAAATTRPLAGPYALYLGKIARNKGTDHLLRVARGAGLEWPLVIAGDGPDRAALEAEAARLGGDVRFTGWLQSNEALRWLAHADILIFPSRGPESLSRVLLEASALGIAIAAMRTGGTADIIEDERTGLLSATADELTADVHRLIVDANLRTRLGSAAQQRAADRFEARNVVARVEELYQSLVAEPVG